MKLMISGSGPGLSLNQRTLQPDSYRITPTAHPKPVKSHTQKQTKSQTPTHYSTMGQGTATAKAECLIATYVKSSVEAEEKSYKSYAD